MPKLEKFFDTYTRWQIFDVFSQIQYNGGMPRQVQACLKLNRRTGLIPVIFLRF